MKNILLPLLPLLLSACATLAPPTVPAPAPTPPVVAPVPPVVAPPTVPPLRAVGWESIDNWRDEELAPTLDTFRQSCVALRNQAAWQAVCAEVATLGNARNEVLRDFFERHFTPYQIVNPDGGVGGLITGYYEPLLRGSRTPTRRYPFPLYAAPDDLLIVDLGALYPELKSMRLRGRLEGRRVVPYYSRTEIEGGSAALKGRELFWVEDKVELFFLQIQGSGRIQLENGEVVRVGYAEQNGHPYKSIGKVLVERGDLPLEKASMQGIQDWGRQNPERLPELLNTNPSYVFFRELPSNHNGGPLGALGVPLTAGRSIAVDPRTVPLGAPVFLATTWPNSAKPLNRLMFAQDTGGAIRGAVRADFFWGFGKDAGKQAGGMKQTGQMWVLLPKGMTPPMGGNGQ